MSEVYDPTDTVDRYSGRKDAMKFINDRIDSASDQISAANERMNDVTDATVNFLEDLPTFDGEIQPIDEYDVDPVDPTGMEMLKDEIDKGLPPRPPVLDEPIDFDVEYTPGGKWDIGDIGMPFAPVLRDNAPTFSGVLPPDHPSITPPTEGINFTPSGYVAGLSDFIAEQIRISLLEQDEIEDIIINNHVDLEGNTGSVAIVDTSLEQAIYDRANTRITREEALTVSKLESSFISRGFPLPPGAFVAGMAQIASETALSRSNLNDDIIKSSVILEQKRTEYELQKAAAITDAQFKHDSLSVQIESLSVELMKSHVANKGVYIDAGVSLEKVLAGIYETEETLRLAAETATVDAEIKIYNSTIDGYKSLVEAYKVEVEAVVAEIQSEIEYNKGLVSIYATELTAVATEVDIAKTEIDGTKVLSEIASTELMSEIEIIKAETDHLDTIAKVYATDISAYSARIDSLVTISTADFTRFKIESESEIAQIMGQVSIATEQIKSAAQIAAVHLEALKSEATLSASIISSSLNSIGTNTTYGYAGKSSYSKTIGRSYDRKLSYEYRAKGADSSSWYPL